MFLFVRFLLLLLLGLLVPVGLVLPQLMPLLRILPLQRLGDGGCQIRGAPHAAADYCQEGHICTQGHTIG